MPLKGTLSGSYNAAVTLTAAGYTNPVTVTGTISLSSAGIDLQAATAWSIINQGILEGPNSPSGTGISLDAGGYVGNAADGRIVSCVGIDIAGAAGTVDNAGTITGGSATLDAGIELDGGGSVTNSGTASGAYGVLLRAGGSVTNAASGVIVGGAYRGVWVTGGVGTVSNAGTIESTGTAHSAVYFSDGGSVANQAGGVITAIYHGIHISGGAATVSNAGRITNSNPSDSAIAAYDGATVVNAAGGVIAGAHHGIYITGGGTVTNAGTIAATGSTTIAVLMLPGAANRVIVDPGAVFSGAVDGGNTVGSSIFSTLELAAGSGTLAGIGSNFENFGSIVFDPGAQWSISGGTAALAGGETIAGFSPGDIVDIVGVTETIENFSSGTLSLGGTAPLDLLLSGNFANAHFHAVPSSDGTDITVACFAGGTRILTDAGEVEVERLQAGARVVSLLQRQLSKLVWIGRRRLREVWAVRVRAGAFGPGLPHRDLVLSPDHAVFSDGVLIPVRYLINGVTVAEEFHEQVFYYHVELAEHGVLLAEGLPAESYLDTGNRGAFANGGARESKVTGRTTEFCTVP